MYLLKIPTWVSGIRFNQGWHRTPAGYYPESIPGKFRVPIDILKIVRETGRGRAGYWSGVKMSFLIF